MITYYLKISKQNFGLNLYIYDMEVRSSEQFPRDPFFVSVPYLKAYGHSRSYSQKLDKSHQLSIISSTSKLPVQNTRTQQIQDNEIKYQVIFSYLIFNLELRIYIVRLFKCI